jgi:3-mercaptopyruvate sulfurtransferase SseA
MQPVQVLKSRNELLDLFAQRGVLLARDQQQQEEGKEQAKAVAAMCGSGVTACPLALVLHSFGHTDVPIYDGSWCAYASLAGVSSCIPH